MIAARQRRVLWRALAGLKAEAGKVFIRNAGRQEWVGGFANLDGMSDRQLLLLALIEISELKAELRAAATLLLGAQKGLSQGEYDDVRGEALRACEGRCDAAGELAARGEQRPVRVRNVNGQLASIHW